MKKNIGLSEMNLAYLQQARLTKVGKSGKTSVVGLNCAQQG